MESGVQIKKKGRTIAGLHPRPRDELSDQREKAPWTPRRSINTTADVAPELLSTFVELPAR
jgi:hypothetical protein